MRLLALILAVAVLATSPACAPKAQTGILPASSFDQDDYLGKVVLLNFWATWCGPCRFELPHLVEIRNTFDPEEVAVVGISVDDERARPVLEEMIERFGINYPIVLDSKRELVGEYPVRDAIPMTFVLDRKGVVKRTYRGIPQDSSGEFNPANVYARDIQALLDQR